MATFFLNQRRPSSVRKYFSLNVAEDFSILVHCHLSWDNVWQRPQQFLSRLAKRHPVLFVETHVQNSLSSPEYEYRSAAGAENVTQLKLTFPRSVWGDGDYVDRERRRLVKAALLEKPLRRFQNPVQWFYDPMAVTAFGGFMNEKFNVYDCMDQLSQFKGAPPELILRERQLLEMADLVFCGGSKLHADKSTLNANCHFFGCGVDVQHFRQARLRATAIPAEVASLPRPILGYYGVIDERLDYRLLNQLARRTTGSVVLLGPLAKISEADLPRHENLHWLGRRSYDELPAYAKAFDVCLMPFALNAATEFINPTKALEYLGAGRPVVSTRVPDVQHLLSSAVNIATDARDFIRQCDREAEAPNRRNILNGLRLADANTWERIVSELEGHLQRTAERQTNASSTAAFEGDLERLPA